jgi:hypothetical protein
MAWWRERLEELDGGVIPAEPRLQAVATEVLPRGVTGRELSRLEDAWAPLLAPFPWENDQADGLRLRGRILFGIGARLLGGDPQSAEAAGVLWSLEDGAWHCSDEQSRIFLASRATDAIFQLPLRVPRKLRPLTILSALTAQKIWLGNRFGRGGAAIWHHLTGRFPR